MKLLIIILCVVILNISIYGEEIENNPNQEKEKPILLELKDINNQNKEKIDLGFNKIENKREKENEKVEEYKIEEVRGKKYNEKSLMDAFIKAFFSIKAGYDYVDKHEKGELYSKIHTGSVIATICSGAIDYTANEKRISITTITLLVGTVLFGDYMIVDTVLEANEYNKRNAIEKIN